MFGAVAPTQYDLRFSLFGMPIRVHPGFWVVSAIMGIRGSDDPRFVFIWVVCVFVSILVHELGHALMAKLFGYPPEIVLHYFGGYAMYQPGYGYSTKRSLLISAAGPGAGFILFGIVAGVVIAVPDWDLYALKAVPLFHANIDNVIHDSSLLETAVNNFLYINLFWGLVNLLPVLPLDGGHICEDICQSISRRDGQTWALRIAIVTAGAVAFYAATHKDLFITFLFGMLCYRNFQQYQSHKRGYW